MLCPAFDDMIGYFGGLRRGGTLVLCDGRRARWDLMGCITGVWMEGGDKDKG